MMKSPLAILIFIFVSLQTLNAQQEKRLALIIGNSDYSSGQLMNPVNDALLMDSVLKVVGFDVILDTNIQTRRDFSNLVRNYGDTLEHYDVSFIYYAGHAVQVNQTNYLVPTQTKIRDEFDVEDNCFPVNRFLKYLSNYKDDQVHILVLDACRDNPFETSWSRGILD